MKPFILSVLLISLIPACSYQSQAQDAYTPGLGELMAQLSNRHGKLWFAGQAQNWELAAYELAEIKEGLETISHFHPRHHEVKDISGQIKRDMDKPLEHVAQAIQNKNARDFAAAYQSMSAGCNNCHRANGFGFNIIVTPRINTYPNQQFDLRMP